MLKFKRNNIFAAIVLVCFFAMNIASAEIINPLNAAADGSSGSVESTFGNPAVGHTAVPSGWNKVGLCDIDVYKKMGMNAALCVNWPPDGWNYNYTAQFETSTAAQAYKRYNLCFLAGSHEDWETAMADYTFILGTMKDSVFTQIGSYGPISVTFNNAVTYIANNKGVYLNSFHVETGADVADGNLAVQISVTSYGVAWPAIDNVLLQTSEIELVCTEPIEGDINNDCIVDFCDFAILMENWMSCSLTPNIACDNLNS
jgi:hypothetical protein